MIWWLKIFCQTALIGEKKPIQTELLIDAKNKADKQVAHLSRWRIKIETDNKKEWDWRGISNDIENVIKNFEECRQSTSGKVVP